MFICIGCKSPEKKIRILWGWCRGGGGGSGIKKKLFSCLICLLLLPLCSSVAACLFFFLEDAIFLPCHISSRLASHPFQIFLFFMPFPDFSVRSCTKPIKGKIFSLSTLPLLSCGVDADAGLMYKCTLHSERRREVIKWIFMLLSLLLWKKLFVLSPNTTNGFHPNLMSFHEKKVERGSRWKGNLSRYMNS